MTSSTPSSQTGSAAFTHDPKLSSFAVPVSTYLSSLPESPSQPQAIAAGALIFSPANKILLVQRAASDSRPHLWEVPGGGVDASDATILHGVAREVFEETGLAVIRVKRLIPAEGGHGRTFVTSRGLRIVKLEFEVMVREGDVKLDEKEHQAFAWVGEEECRAGRTTEGLVFRFTARGQEESILEGFRLRRGEENV